MKVSKNKVSNSQKEYQTYEKPKRLTWRAKKGILSYFLTSIVAKHQKIEGDTLVKIKVSEKSLTMPKQLKGGTLWVFQHPFCRKTSKN